MAPHARLRLRWAGYGICLTVALCACSAKVSAPPETPGAVRRGDEAFRYQEYDTAIRAYRAYLDQVDRGPYTARAFYKTALAQFRLKEFHEALQTLDDLSLRYPKGNWVQVEALRGDVARAMGHPTAALNAWEAAWKISGDADHAQLRQRILRTARELNDVELTSARRAVNSKDVGKLLDQQIALRQAPGINEGIPGGGAGETAAEESTAETETVETAASETAATETETSADSSAAQAETTGAPPPHGAASEAAIATGKPAPTASEEVLAPSEEATTPSEEAIAASEEPVEEEPIQGAAKVGCLLPLSGPQRQVGQRSLRALRLIFGRDNDQLVLKDTGSDPTGAANILDELAADPNVLVVIGPLQSDAAQAMAPRAEQARLPLLLLSAGDQPAGHFVLPAGVTRSREVATLLDYAMARVRLRRFGVLYPKDTYGKEFLDTFRAEVERRGGTVVGTDAYAPGAGNVASDVGTVRKWRDGQNLQAVFLPDNAVAAAHFAKPLQDAMPDVTLLGVHGWEELVRQDGALNGVLFADTFYGGSTRAGTRAFVEAFQQTYGEMPGVVEAQAYDAALLARRALEAGARSRSELLRQLHALGPVEGATGELQVTRDGVQRDVFLLQVSDGKLREIGATRNE